MLSKRWLPLCVMLAPCLHRQLPFWQTSFLCDILVLFSLVHIFKFAIGKVSSSFIMSIDLVYYGHCRHSIVKLPPFDRGMSRRYAYRHEQMIQLQMIIIEILKGCSVVSILPRSTMNTNQTPSLYLYKMLQNICTYYLSIYYVNIRYIIYMYASISHTACISYYVHLHREKTTAALLRPQDGGLAIVSEINRDGSMRKMAHKQPS